MLTSIDILKGLNDKQSKAVLSKSKRVLCYAGAGAGKTSVTTRRVGYLMLSKRISGANIACLTFTNYAASEMKKRILDIDYEKGQKVFCNTFHKLAIDIINRFGTYIGFSPNFTIINQDNREELLDQLTDKYKFKCKKNSVIKAIEAYERYEEEKIPGKELLNAYVNYMRENNMCDIDMLQYYAYLLLRDYPDVQQYYNEKYKYISVDEFQDTNDIQVMILDAINPDNLFVVGDIRQAIYGYRNANCEHIMKFKDKYPDAEVIELTDNYRSTDVIVEASNSIIRSSNINFLSDMVAHRTGDAITHIISENQIEEVKDIVAELSRFDDIDYKDMAILARTNKELDVIEDYLKYVKIDYVRSKKKKLNSDGIKLLNYIQDIQNTNKLMELLKLSHAVTENELLELNIEALENCNTLYRQALNNEKVSLLIKRLEMLKYDRNIKSYVQKAFHILKYNGDIELDYLDKWIDEKNHMGEINLTVDEFLKDINFGINIDNIADGIRLSTVHASKGLEWSVVAICGMCEGNFPKIHADQNEEIRLFYTGVTRAASKLIISSYKNGYDFRKREVSLNQSRFIDYCL